MKLFKRSAAALPKASEDADPMVALDGVVDPLTGRGLASSGRVQSLALKDGQALAVLDVGGVDPAVFAATREAAEAALAAIPGVQSARVVLTADRPVPPTGPQSRRAALSPELKAQGGLSPSRAAVRPDHVRRVIAVASGKGGVGKSTVAVNLALAFARQGLSAGLLDADVYGPSAPRMLGLDGRPEIDADKRIVPLQAHGLKVMSVGFLLDAGAPLIWRGPMASSALTQMAAGVAWGTADAPLDVLVVDLPPGTGDVQLTLVQKVTLDGVVIVSTPQALALDDARRAAAMFAKTDVAVLGVVENMAFLDTPSGRLHPFGQGGARRFAEEAGLPFLVEVALDPALGRAGDTGEPAGADSTAIFDALAARLTPPQSS